MTIRIALDQFDFTGGASTRNAERIAAMIVEARDLHRADVVLFPELALSGYPPEDLLARPQFLLDCEAVLQKIAADATGRSEEHTYELQSLMRNSYAVICLQKKNKITHPNT